MSYENFLKEILGETGKKALDNSSEILKPVIVPRAIVSWVRTMGSLGYDGELPGVKNSYFSLYKNENSFEGALKIKNELFVFENADLAQVAASVGAALEIELEEVNHKLKNKDLTSLGNSIDLLVKTEIIKKNNLSKGESGRPGPQAKPNSPVGPTKQLGGSMQQPFQEGRPLSQPPNLAVGQGQKIKAKEEAQKLKITKSESSKKCKRCDKNYFEDGVFIGCDCLRPLSKAVDTEKNPEGYTLIFKVHLPEESLESLIMLLKD